jgi:hypothetical protein
MIVAATKMAAALVRPGKLAVMVFVKRQYVFLIATEKSVVLIVVAILMAVELVSLRKNVKITNV